MDKAIVFIGQVYPCGVYRHLAYMGVSIYNALSPTKIDFFYGATRHEANAGAWDIVRKVMPASHILTADKFSVLIGKIEDLFCRYKTVLVHGGGGWGQMKHLVPLKRKYGSRLKIVVVTHSYRHDSWKRIFMSAFQALLYRWYVEKVVFQCPYALRRFCGGHTLISLSGKSAIIPLGCEEFFTEGDSVPSDLPQGNAKSLLLDRGKFKFVYLACFRPGKMHAWLVETLSKVLHDHANAVLLLCGDGDESVKCQIEHSICRCGLQNQVVMPGRISRADIPWVLEHCNCAVVPSRAETFGHAFVEPMMAGLPVLGTRVGAGEYLLQDYMTGFSFVLNDREQLQSRAGYMITHPTVCRQMGKRAQELARRMFSHVNVGCAHAELCLDILNK